MDGDHLDLIQAGEEGIAPGLAQILIRGKLVSRAGPAVFLQVVVNIPVSEILKSQQETMNRFRGGGNILWVKETKERPLFFVQVMARGAVGDGKAGVA